MVDNEAVSNTMARLLSFAREQKRHWKRLRKGIIPETLIINGWIESCDFVEDDVTLLAEASMQKKATVVPDKVWIDDMRESVVVGVDINRRFITIIDNQAEEIAKLKTSITTHDTLG